MMEVISSRRYEARPPANVHSGILVDPENSVATVKEEEWETRKKKEITTTRQIETRVKRQVVLEDGEVVVDSGPLVTTNTTEDVEQQEHTTQERRTTGDDPKEVEWPTGSGDGVVQKESNETVVRSREEVEERLETEDRQQLGDISDEVYLRAIKSNRGDLRVALAESSKQLVPQSGPRVLQHTTKTNKVVDTEKKLERKELKADGLIITETKKTVEHEEIKDDELPEDGTGADQDSESETRKESSQRFIKKRDEDVVDYVSGGEKIGREMRYVSETTEGERIGDWPPPPTTMRTARLHKHSGFPGDGLPTARKDALTKKPLDLEEEDEARKVETSKWLESHFGSESRSSHGSLEPDEPVVQPGTNTSFINVTMKSMPVQGSSRDRDYQNSSRPHHRTSGRDSNSPSGYYHGISEWSERYQGAEKQNNHGRTASPLQYPVESPSKNNSYAHENVRSQMESSYSRSYESNRRQQEHQEPVQRTGTPSPPLRRRNREQLTARIEEKTNYESTAGRMASPVHVVQRTWESRSRDVQGQVPESQRYSLQKTPPLSRSTSPTVVASTPIRRDKKNLESSVTPRESKAAGQSKYKIGESFRKLVGKLRSASSERKNKRGGSNSMSQLTQTEDSSTYLQYNVIDRNIPLVSEYATQSNDKPPERPPRSPKTQNKSGKVTRTIENQEQQWQRESGPPVHRYYLGEDPFGGSIYGREKGYKDARPPGRHRNVPRAAIETEHSAMESSSLGRFSKSTSRLANEYEGEEHFRSAQTLPRKLHYSSQPRQNQSASRRHANLNSSLVGKQGNTHSPLQATLRSNQNRQYGSMINISIKNTVTAPKISKQTNNQAPAKPERTYKSSLARSKSFNVEANTNDDLSPSTTYKSNLHLNRLGETPPLKSPGILASISRSNRDLFKADKYEY
ncbi:uncharacterized protein LOC107272590 [Cephus cinctus]|uniref:Uncharacterized protein LOC107272590 n=1 Tax=Cephus cinctus TaxID=211228 RepID=A0AAJ7CAG1_CEPCN|nr:uncharacterized protein LOC107272590 [Cephus cinctus]